MCGYIKMYRDVQNHWIYQNAEYYRWWSDLLFDANYKDTICLSGNKRVVVKRGELVAGINSLMKQWKRSKTKVITFLKMLESEHMITRRVDNLLPIITICNYEGYQGGIDTPLDNLKDTLSDTHLDTSKEIKESKEYIYSSNPRVREELLEWDAERENRYASTFKGQGSAIPLAKKIGKTPREVMNLLEIYMAHREIKNRGHKDYNEFLNLFMWHVENKKIAIPEVAPQTQKRKVITSEDTYRLMQEMGWQYR